MHENINKIMKYVAELVRFTPRNDDIKHCETLTVKDKKTTVLKSISSLTPTVLNQLFRANLAARRKLCDMMTWCDVTKSPN